jgi:hypothetical protein
MKNYSDDVDAAVEAGKQLHKDRPQRTVTVDVQIADRGDLQRETFRADLDDANAMTELKQSVQTTIERSTGG